MIFDPKTILFFVLAAILVIAALRVVTARNPVHAALFLVLTFFTAAALWMLLEAEFLSIVLVLVYVGAVMVLFLFVVMMLDLDLNHLREGFKQFLPVASLVGAIVVAEMAIVLVRGFIGTTNPVQAIAAEAATNNTKALGTLLYTNYLFSFEVAGLILLVAIVAAVALTLRRRKGAKAQDIAEQVRTRAQDRVRIVTDMNAVSGGKDLSK